MSDEVVMVTIRCYGCSRDYQSRERIGPPRAEGVVGYLASSPFSPDVSRSSAPRCRFCRSEKVVQLGGTT